MKKSVLISLAFAGVFIMGAVAGGFVAARFVPAMPYQRASDLFSDQQFQTVSEMLQLTPEQRTRILPIVTKAAELIPARRREVRAAFEQMQDEFRKELTDEQRARYDDWRKGQRDTERRFQHWAREQRAHHPEFSHDAQAGKPAQEPARDAAPPRVP